MGAIPDPHSHPKNMHLDEVVEGRPMWVSIGLTVLSVFVSVLVVVLCHINILVFRPEGVFIPIIGLHASVLS